MARLTFIQSTAQPHNSRNAHKEQPFIFKASSLTIMMHKSLLHSFLPIFLISVALSRAEDFCFGNTALYSSCTPSGGECKPIFSGSVPGECTEWHASCVDGKPVVVTDIDSTLFSDCGITSQYLNELSGELDCYVRRCVGSPDTDDCGLSPGANPFSYHFDYSFDAPSCGGVVTSGGRGGNAGILRFVVGALAFLMVSS